MKDELAAAVQRGQPIRSLLTDDREFAAALSYYARDIGVPMQAWRDSPVPRSHFEMTRPFTAAAPEPVLLVSPRAPAPALTGRFETVGPKTTRTLPTGDHATRTVHFSLLAKYQER